MPHHVVVDMRQSAASRNTMCSLWREFGSVCHSKLWPGLGSVGYSKDSAANLLFGVSLSFYMQLGKPPRTVSPWARHRPRLGWLHSKQWCITPHVSWWMFLNSPPRAAPSAQFSFYKNFHAGRMRPTINTGAAAWPWKCLAWQMCPRKRDL